MTATHLNSDTGKPSQDFAQQKNKVLSRLEGLAIPAVVGLMLLSAYLVFKLGLVPTHTVNKGDLVSPPFSVKQLNFMVTNGGAIDWSEKKWRILIPTGQSCDNNCLDNLYKTRQVHKLLAGKASRVERILLLTERSVSSTYADVLEQDYPNIKQVMGGYTELKALLSSSGISGDPVENQRYFVIDQEGYLMMSYGVEHSGKDLLADLKRLLKYSYEN